jgi:hypothetical protein
MISREGENLNFSKPFKESRGGLWPSFLVPLWIFWNQFIFLIDIEARVTLETPLDFPTMGIMPEGSYDPFVVS